MIAHPMLLSMCALGVLLTCSPAWACGSPDLLPYETRTDPEDTTPPAAPAVSFSVKRGRAPEREGCSESASSCDDVGSLRLFLNEDEEADPDLGYIVEVVSGDARLISRPGEPLALQYDELMFTWSDGEGTDDLSLVLDVWSIDRAGNRSARATRIEFDSAGSDGCAIAARSNTGWCLLLAAMFLQRRRRVVRS